MLLGNILIIFVVVGFTASQNSTDDLEVRVTLLENDVATLQDELEEVETDNTLQDQRFDNVEDDVSENSNDIDDLDTDVNNAEETILILQQEMSTLEITINLLLERFDVLETVVETLSNSTSQDLEKLSAALNETDGNVQDATARLETVEEDVTGLAVEITALEESDSDQNDRMAIIENEVDEWDDRIVQLEVANSDIQERLTILEEVVIVPWVACSSGPCTNGGTCIDVNVDTYVCMCKDGYFGEACQSSYANTSFLASVDHDPGNPPDPIVFNVARLNEGGYYDPTTGIYTVPVDGTYEFIVHIFSNTDPIIGAYVEVDNVPVAYAETRYGGNDDPTVDMVLVLSLSAGQQVWVSDFDMVGMQGDDDNGMNSWFSGHLIHTY